MFIVIFLLFVIVPILYKIKKYNTSNYKKETQSSYKTVLFDKGYTGEFLTYDILEKTKGNHRIIVNAYIPKDENKTTEIDIIFIHETGIYVIESKNYGGWIFGSEKNKYWMQTFKSGKKEKFYNPIWQNNTHIKYLKNILKDIDYSYFKSLIVFSERCTLKKIEVNSQTVNVVNRYNLSKVLNDIIGNSKVIFTLNEIEEIYIKLKSYTNVNKEVKKQHIANLNAR